MPATLVAPEKLEGEFVGNGFKLMESAMDGPALTQRLSAAQAQLTCHRDCERLASAEERANLAHMQEQDGS